MHEEGGPVARQREEEPRGGWRSDWMRFGIWLRVDDGAFTEVLLAGWSLVIAVFMGLLARQNGSSEPSVTLEWCLTAVFLLLAGILGLHLTYRWSKWCRNQR